MLIQVILTIVKWDLNQIEAIVHVTILLARLMNLSHNQYSRLVLVGAVVKNPHEDIKNPHEDIKTLMRIKKPS